MKRYYKPISEELVLNQNVEIYNPEDEEWTQHLITGLSNIRGLDAILLRGDLRVKYLDEDDFKSLGFKLEAPFIGTDSIFTGEFKLNEETGEEEEVYEEINLYDYNNLRIFKKSTRVGTFRPNDYKENCTFKGNKYHFKNLYELSKYLDNEKNN